MAGKDKKKKSKASAGFRALLYGAGFAIFVFVFIKDAGVPEKNLSGKGLQVVEVIQSGASKSRAGIAIFGPINITRKDEYISTKIDTIGGLDIRGRRWVAGEFAVIPAKAISGDSGGLMSAGSIKQTFADAEKSELKKILDVYSFGFEFWKNNRCTYIAPNEINSHFISSETGPHYVMAEFTSNFKGFSPANFRIQMVEGDRPLFYSFLGVVFFGLMFLINVTEAKSVPTFIRHIFNLIRKLVGVALMPLGIGGAIFFLGTLGEMGEEECINGWLVALGFITLIPLSIVSIVVGKMMLSYKVKK